MEHIIIIGFKKAGKTTVGKELSILLDLPFVDFDNELEKEYQKITGEQLDFRHIAQKRGMEFFRTLEHNILTKVLDGQSTPCVISMGGGTPIPENNQRLLENHLVISLKVDKEILFERIMETGRPVFFPEGLDDRAAFEKIWNERAGVYERIARLEVENNGTLEEVMERLKEKLNCGKYLSYNYCPGLEGAN